MTDTDPSPPAPDDDRSDVRQIVEARKDAAESAHATHEAVTPTASGLFSGNAGTGGEIKNQDRDAQ